MAALVPPIAPVALAVLVHPPHSFIHSSPLTEGPNWPLNHSSWSKGRYLTQGRLILRPQVYLPGHSHWSKGYNVIQARRIKSSLEVFTLEFAGKNPFLLGDEIVRMWACRWSGNREKKRVLRPSESLYLTVPQTAVCPTFLSLVILLFLSINHLSV